MAVDRIFQDHASGIEKGLLRQLERYTVFVTVGAILFRIPVEGCFKK
uniref:Uncharacterized protein n=1 Tax=Candidatus Kentrum sp. FW TaxID=2126338 RepID=A0A450S4W5_9GAMM|nr:MAG: hypothetical protein BECKFW1821B_GA0114236_100190 [Candidatus Kentron sp. FW]VFJ48873.1 MAG: hypothetical protein BECKFW1821A_GA0114235_10212 [Candidatus Kentron sp. FW]